MEDRDELLRHYRLTRDALLAAISGIPDEVMIEPTLDGWSVKDHLAHIALWDDLRAGEVERISAGHASVWRMTGEQDDALNRMAHRLRRDMSLDQARWELTASRQRLLDAITGASERGLDASLYGEPALRSTHEAAHTEWIKHWRASAGH